MTEREIPEHVKQRLDRQARHIEELEAQVATIQPDRLVTDVAHVLEHAAFWGEPAPAGTDWESGRSGKPGSRPPASSGDRRIRNAGKWFHRQVELAVQGYWQRADGEHRTVEAKNTPRTDQDGNLESLPRVKCGSCRKWNVRMVITPDMELLVRDRCVKCDRHLPK